MTHRFHFETSIERNDEEIDVSVTYSVTPFIRATYWQPAEGGEVEIIAVKRDGCHFHLADDEERALIEQCEARASSDMEEERGAEADWLYEQYRDREMMDRWENAA